MQIPLKLLVPTIAASVLISACGGSSSPSTATGGSSGPGAIVKTASNSKVGGTILTTTDGMTLYTLAGETNGKWKCTSKACVGSWHPLAAQGGSTPTGANGLGTAKRPDGSEQVTHNGAPLYTFVNDTAPGQVTGNGFKDQAGVWHAATTSGAAKKSSSGGAPVYGY